MTQDDSKDRQVKVRIISIHKADSNQHACHQPGRRRDADAHRLVSLPAFLEPKMKRGSRIAPVKAGLFHRIRVDCYDPVRAAPTAHYRAESGGHGGFRGRRLTTVQKRAPDTRWLADVP